MSAYFTDKTFAFLRGLARHNHREWFQAHKADYEAHLRQPFLRLIGELQPDIAAISPHYRADPRPVGGSLFRIHRDTRFANDKTPYKTWAGARFFHERSRQLEAPSFYLHIQPGNCFLGAGLWHPETITLRRIRDFIVENPEAWKQAVHAPAFRKRFQMGGESLSRPPRGYPAEHPLIEDLKRKSFVCWRNLDDATVTGPRLRQSVAEAFKGAAPLVDYLCAALDLEF
ncbi:DUF2461 domain-containing protein [Rehaibacterium terrae]|jgi:uncharacterized protein (TIGR02453 family)|uniref:Uncharacterized protein (TIGR02453 family) n=1 Tax=Rehaibacterium terrae TaxID=1341696 RepID=A0A7W7Y1A0_9GAMM|nr:DUF2461 domain-containing protein [Rehaibacterium terrae]MBB5016253.1 uncharacterized protein (TIGR02453 family) [Rehaibacterium terrae]